MIAVECMLQQLEEQKHGLNPEDHKLREELLAHMVELSESVTGEMESFTATLFLGLERLKVTQQFPEIDEACVELLAASLSVVQTGLAVIGKYGHAPWIALALNNISARTRLIWRRMQLSAHPSQALMWFWCKP